MKNRGIKLLSFFMSLLMFSQTGVYAMEDPRTMEIIEECSRLAKIALEMSDENDKKNQELTVKLNYAEELLECIQKDNDILKKRLTNYGKRCDDFTKMCDECIKSRNSLLKSCQDCEKACQDFIKVRDDCIKSRQDCVKVSEDCLKQSEIWKEEYRRISSKEDTNLNLQDELVQSENGVYSINSHMSNAEIMDTTLENKNGDAADNVSVNPDKLNRKDDTRFKKDIVVMAVGVALISCIIITATLFHKRHK